MLEYATQLLSKGVPLPTVGFLLLTLLPQALGATIPMAFITGLLMSLGRLSGDREGVALLACGVSPLRLLRPVLIMAVVAGGADMYTLIKLVPDSNQRFREETYKFIARQAESDIKPGQFYEGFPGKVVYVLGSNPGGGWSGVMLADTGGPNGPVVTLANQGFLQLDAVKRQVSVFLPGESTRYVPGDEPGIYDMSRANDLRFTISADAVFGDGNIDRGIPEMSIADLRKEEERLRAAGISPHRYIMQRHQMFSFPVACVVFALLGLALGLHTRKDGKLGGFTLGIAGIFLYYALFATAEGLTKGHYLPAEWARWLPNIGVGVIAIAALWSRRRSTGGELVLPSPSALLARFKKRAPADAAAPLGRPNRVIIVIRIPELPLPRPRLLDLYVARKYASVVLLSFVGLLGLYYIGTFIDKSEKLFKGQADTRMLLEYFYYSTPQFIVYLVPMAVLVAVLATIGGLTRTGELVVMRACGVSLYRAAAPLLLLSTLWSAGLFFLDDRVLARANRKAEALDDTIRGNAPHTSNPVAGQQWLADRDGRLYYYAVFDVAHSTLYNLSVFETAQQPYRVTSHLVAKRAQFNGGADRWRASDGWVEHFPTLERATRENFSVRTVTLAKPTSFAGAHNDEVELMTFGDLRQHIKQLSASGFSLADTEVKLQSRIAFPMVALVMTVLGIPFAVTTGRRGALYGIGLAIILASVYWLLNTFFLAVGTAALLPAVLAAWSANILFLAAAAYMTLTVRT